MVRENVSHTGKPLKEVQRGVILESRSFTSALLGNTLSLRKSMINNCINLDGNTDELVKEFKFENEMKQD